MTTNLPKQANSADGPGSGAHFSAADLSAVVSAKSVPPHCPNCGSQTQPSDTICAGCGIRLRKSARQIRCRHCHHQASSQLVICPSCGRHLRPAPSRLLSWGLPLLLALLIAVVLFDRLGIRIQMGQGSEVAAGEVTELVLNPTQTSIPEPTAEPTATATAEAIVETSEVVTIALVAERPTPTATAEPSATALPTATATATQTSIPTATFTATPTPLPTLDAMSYTVKAGDTLLGIARRFGVSVDDLLVANDLTAQDATRIRPDMVLVIPPGGVLPATAAPTTPPATPTATSTPAPAVSYTLRAGDTVIGIATRFGITVDNLLAANGLTAQDAPGLQIGSVLVIPAPGQTFPTPTPTARPATSVAPSPTPVPTQASTLRLDAPVLIGPESGTPMRCAADVRDSLTWKAVAYMAPGDEYALHLGFISGPPQADGSETVSWAITLRRSLPSWQLESELCSQAPQEYNRQWRWYVQVVNGDTPVSPPSSIWAFSWN